MIALLLALQLGAPPAPVPALVAPMPPPEATWSVPVAHSLGVLAGMRLGLSVLWPDAYDPLPLGRSGRQFASAYSRAPEYRSGRSFLESDGDPWQINLIGHPLFGSEIYQRVRQCGGAGWQALAFTAAASAVWEFGIESFNKRPSTIDLLATPIVGAALGEARYRAGRWLRGQPRGFWRTLGSIVVDPFGEAERSALHTRC